MAYHWGAGKNHEFFRAPVHILAEAFDELLKGDELRDAGGKLVQVMGVETVFGCIQPIGVFACQFWGVRTALAFSSCSIFHLWRMIICQGPPDLSALVDKQPI